MVRFLKGRINGPKCSSRQNRKDTCKTKHLKKMINISDSLHHYNKYENLIEINPEILHRLFLYACVCMCVYVCTCACTLCLHSRICGGQRRTCRSCFFPLSIWVLDCFQTYQKGGLWVLTSHMSSKTNKSAWAAFQRKKGTQLIENVSKT